MMKVEIWKMFDGKFTVRYQRSGSNDWEFYKLRRDDVVPMRFDTTAEAEEQIRKWSHIIDNCEMVKAFDIDQQGREESTRGVSH